MDEITEFFVFVSLLVLVDHIVFIQSLDLNFFSLDKISRLSVFSMQLISFFVIFLLYSFLLLANGVIDFDIQNLNVFLQVLDLLRDVLLLHGVVNHLIFDPHDPVFNNLFWLNDLFKVFFFSFFIRLIDIKGTKTPWGIGKRRCRIGTCHLWRSLINKEELVVSLLSIRRFLQIIVLWSITRVFVFVELFKTMFAYIIYRRHRHICSVSWSFTLCLSYWLMTGTS